jgi:putative nucleotidyltransferase with HDIG domain
MNVAASVIDHKALLVSAEALGGLPVTVSRLAAVVSDPGHDLSDIVEIVTFDASLTAALLRRANSVALGGRVQITTVRNAAILLGSGSLLSVALSTSVSRRLSRPIPGYGLAEGELWKQSVAASLAAEVISAAASVDVPAEASTAALLHDLGKVVLAQHFGAPVLDMISQAAAADNLGLLEAESTVFGVNHADIGGLVAQQWKLPHTIVDAIIHHHETTGHCGPLSAVVSLAHAMVPDVLTAVEAFGENSGPAASARADPPAVTHHAIMVGLGLDPAAYDDLLLGARHRYCALAERYDVS